MDSLHRSPSEVYTLSPTDWSEYARWAEEIDRALDRIRHRTDNDWPRLKSPADRRQDQAAILEWYRTHLAD